MKRNQLIFWSIAFYFAIISLIHFLRWGGEYYDAITTAINIITLLIPIFLGFLTFRSLGLKTLSGKSVFLLWLAMLAYLIADILWLIVDEAVISVADIFWVMTYPLIVLGLFFGIKSIDKSFFKDQAVVLWILLFVMFIYFAAFPLVSSEGLNFLGSLFTIGYAVADLLLFLPMVFIISFIFSDYDNRAWVLIGFAMIFFTLGDFYYAINYNFYEGGDLIDLTWYLSYLLYGAGFVLMKEESSK